MSELASLQNTKRSSSPAGNEPTFADGNEKAVSRNSELATETVDDLALVRACQSGDVTAFEELIKRYDVKLLRLACLITHNREDAEEAVQDAFLKAYTGLNQFDEKASFSIWLTRFAVNESLMKLRKGHATSEHYDPTEEKDEGIHFDVADWAPSFEQLYSATELRGILVKSLDSLSPTLRVVFVLRDVEGFSGDETAEILRLALSAVKARLLRARLQLRDELSKHFRKPIPARVVQMTARLGASEPE